MAVRGKEDEQSSRLAQGYALPEDDTDDYEAAAHAWRQEVALVGSEASSGLRWIEHENTELLLLQFRRGSASDARQALSAMIDALGSRPPTSILLLADLSEAVYFSGVPIEWQQVQELVASRCKKIAAIGVAGLIQTAIKIMLQRSARLRFFSEVAAAKSWLVDWRDQP